MNKYSADYEYTKVSGSVGHNGTGSFANKKKSKANNDRLESQESITPNPSSIVKAIQD